ncbi:MAG: hypothetical protein JWR50_3293 [Mucilaginibacter sp.]|nr:hypothetical protein [Mucilaginibacter sp.]
MKKTTIIALLLLIAYYAHAQNDDCRKIKKHVNLVQGITEFKSPSVDMGLIFYKTIAKGDTTYQVDAYGQSPSRTFDAKGIYMKLDNGDFIMDETLEAARTALDPFTYRYIATLKLNKEEIDGLKQFKIVKFGIAGINYDVSKKDASKYQNWLICLLGDK